MTTAQHQYPQLKEQYERLCELGEGAFGKVYLVEQNAAKGNSTHTSNNQNMNHGNFHSCSNSQEANKSTVGNQLARFQAAKKLKPYMRKKVSNPGTLKIENYPEIKVMQSLEHRNVMSIREIIQENKGYEVNHYVMMDLGIPLMELTRHKEVALSIQQLKCLIYQMVQGIQHIHEQGFMHRDIKPCNIYLMNDGTLKIGDFSISRPIHTQSTAPMMAEVEEEKTGNVTTRHYRAPQIIYGSKHYDQSIDIWGLGCTIAELLLHQTLFPGTSDIQQLEFIFSVLGYPQEHWPQAEQLPYYLEFDNSCQPKGLKNILPNVPQPLLDFISSCLSLDPKKRPSIKQLRNCSFLANINPKANSELAKICLYLHEKNLKNLFVKVK